MAMTARVRNDSAFLLIALGALLIGLWATPTFAETVVDPIDGTATPSAICMDCEPEEPPPPQPPLRGASFVSQSLPTSMIAGDTYAVSVQMKNTGTATWTLADGYKLGSQNPIDNVTWGLGRVGVSGSVAYGQTAVFNFTIKAPSSPGTYNFQWRMVDEGQAWFGATSSNVAITVNAAAGPKAPPLHSRTDELDYHDNLAIWVLGQQSSSTNIDTGLVESRTDYDVVTALPTRTFAFGKLQRAFTYDTSSSVTSGQRGTLKTVSDGRDTSTYNTTVILSDWMRGTPQKITYPATPDQANASKTASIDIVGQISSVTDENGLTTCYGYDGIGRLKSITYPSEASLGACDTSEWNQTLRSFSYVAGVFGLPNHWRMWERTGSGYKLTHFDPLLRPVIEEAYVSTNVANTRSITVKRYDQSGRIAFQSYPRASLSDYADTSLTGVHTTYDSLGRVLTVAQDNEIDATQPLITATDYLSNDEGPYTRLTSPNGFQTRAWHQAFDEPSTSRPVEIRAPEGTYTTIARDPFGKPRSITRHNATNSISAKRSYVYYGSQELCKVIEPESGSLVMGYDGTGNLLWSAAGQSLPNPSNCDVQYVDASHKAVRSYDQRNRVKTLSFPDGRGNTTYSYTPDSLLASIAANNDGSNIVTHNYTYNNRRLLTNEQMAWNSINWNVVHAYNANGHLFQETFPGNLTITYAPNALGQPTQVGSYAAGVSYFPNGAVEQFTYGNGIVHRLTQNARQLPNRSLDSYGTFKFLDDYYDFDPNGNVAAITDGATNRGQRGNRSMTYDGLDRLKTTASSMYGLTTAQYSYDVLDNLTRVKIGGAYTRDHWYCYDGNWRLTNVKTTSCDGASVIGFGYDPQGNVINKNGSTGDFDFGNRLRRATVGSATTTYIYDGHGRRARDLTGESRYSFYTQSGQLAFTSDSRTNKYTNYIYLGGSLIATREWPHGGGTFVAKYQHTDALGSPIVITDASRNIVERNEYEPYGKTLDQTEDEITYAGHLGDAATGLIYMQQRYYDPMIGRFLSVDPVAVRPSGDNFNRYWYANNNPYKFTDPDGRETGAAFKVVNAATNGGPIESPQIANHPELVEWGVAELLCGFCDLNAVSPAGSGALQPIASPIEGLAAGGVSSGLRGVLGGTRSILTPHGPALQASTPEALAALRQVQNGAPLYRTGNFGVQNAAEGQFWSLQNPMTTAGYARQMGMPGTTQQFNWVTSGRLAPGQSVITRPAPGIGSNTGGSMEAVVNPGAVRIDWFTMP